MSWIKNIWVTILILTGFTAAAQDIHFSQYMASPLNLSPALTGLFDGEYRFTGNYRNQWNSVTTPYKTFSFSAEKLMANGLFNNDFVGLGLKFYSDKAGDINFSTNKAALSLGYHKALSVYANNFLTVGFEAGGVQRKFDIGEMTFDSQFDGFGHNPSLPSNENIKMDSRAYIDVATGLTWYYAPAEQTSIYAGGAISHLTSPDQSYLDENVINLHRKYSAFAGGQVPLNNRFSLLPSALFLSQGPHSQLFFGTFGQYRLTHVTDQEEIAILFGTYYRWDDAFTVITRLDYHKWSIGFSYDINTSALTAASSGRGGPEISLMYIIRGDNYDRKRKIISRPVICPKF